VQSKDGHDYFNPHHLVIVKTPALDTSVKMLSVTRQRGNKPVAPGNYQAVVEAGL